MKLGYIARIVVTTHMHTDTSMLIIVLDVENDIGKMIMASMRCVANDLQ